MNLVFGKTFMKIGNTTQTDDAKEIPANFVKQQSFQDEDADALLIHEQLMEQYAETFEKLAQ